MKCAGCGFEAPSDFAFCSRCGRKLAAACPSCGATCSPECAFCPTCGARLARVVAEQHPTPPAETTPISSQDVEHAEEADRRPVSVLFADLSGFTALSERLDPEDVRAFQSDLFQEMASAVELYGGYVEKFVGDAVMALFGAPLAHEDDPQRALHAALAMHERMQVLNHRWERRLGEALTLHVGVNTGPVVAGNLGSTAGSAYAVTGDVVNTASRLQNAAEPGQTLISHTTYRLTQHAFTFEPLGEVTVKGKSKPVPVYRLLGVLSSLRSARGLEAHGLVAPLVGRDDELGQMVAAFERVLGGRAQLVSLIGEAGAGKSRLLREFFEKLAASGQLKTAAVRRAVCSSLGEQTYGVLAAFLRDAYGVAPNDPLEVVRSKLISGLRMLTSDGGESAAIMPLLGHVLGLESADLQLRYVEPEQIKRQIFMAARTLFEWRLRQGPLLLVVEDLHWADAASIELLRFIVDRLADRRLMVLLAYRPSFDAGALSACRATHTAIRLAPLSSGGSEALLAALFGPSANQLPASLRELIVTRAGGNPFYLEEIVRNLIEGGIVVREDTGWRCAADAATMKVPPTIQGLLLSRLDRLPPGGRRLIQESAVLGSTFEQRLLRLVTSEPNACESNLELLQDAELLEEVPGGGGERMVERRYRFTHALVQEAVYDNMLVRRRTELHGRAGHALETLYGVEPERLEELEALGHHWSLSSDKRKGARYLLAAGDWARRMYANEDAARHYQRALKTLDECEGCESEWLTVRERLGDILGPMGRREAALGHFEALGRSYEAAGDRPAQARVYRKIGRLYWDIADRDRAFACYQAGLALLEGDTEGIELAHLYQEMGRLAFRSGDNHSAIEWAQRAVAHAERLAASCTSTDPDTQKDIAAAISHAYNTLGVARARMGGLDEAVGHIEQSVAIALAKGLLQAACRGYGNLGVLYSTRDPSRAIENCLSGLEMAKKIGDLGFQSRLYANLAVAYCALTNRCEEDGIGAARAAIELDRQLGQLDHLAVPLIVLGQIYQCHGGNSELAVQCYREAMELAETIGEPQLLFPCYDGLATLYLEMGDEAQAEKYMRKAQEVCERAGVEPDSLMVLPFLD